jgi:hypothetical protein
MSFFQQMEADMAVMNIPDRPTAYSQQTGTKLYKEYDFLEDETMDIIQWMRGNRNGYSEEYWPINQRLCIDWRGLGKKNPKRDFRKYAQFTALEVLFVDSYRKHLLENSAAAAYLRSTLKEAWVPCCEPRKITYSDVDKLKLRSVTFTSWDYPDMIKLSEEKPKAPLVDVKALAKIREENNLEKKYRDALKALLLKAQSLEAFFATPETKMLNDKIRHALDVLEQVC